MSYSKKAAVNWWMETELIKKESFKFEYEQRDKEMTFFTNKWYTNKVFWGGAAKFPPICLQTETYSEFHRKQADLLELCSETQQATADMRISCFGYFAAFVRWTAAADHRYGVGRAWRVFRHANVRTRLLWIAEQRACSRSLKTLTMAVFKTWQSITWKNNTIIQTRIKMSYDASQQGAQICDWREQSVSACSGHLHNSTKEVREQFILW